MKSINNCGNRVKHIRESALFLLYGAALGPIAAYAQDTSAIATAPEQRPSESNGEIIVTAQRQSQIARDVPLSISAQTGEQLQKAGATDTRDLTALTPGLKMDRVGAFSIPAIRGVTTQLTTAGVDVNVATYLDDVYQPSQLTGTFDLPDVERIEVLKGPQGTLFGRNATGGAIRVFTRSPSYTTTGKFVASYGSFNEAIAKGFVSAPIVADKLAASVAGYYRRSDGYNHDLLNDGARVGGDESWLVRGKLRFDPTDRISFLATGFASYRKDGSTNRGLPLNGNTQYAQDPTVVIPTRPYDTAMNLASNVVRQHGFSLKGTVDLDAVTLTSITAYQKSTSFSRIDGDYSYTPDDTGAQYRSHSTDRSFSQELTLSSMHGHLIDYSVGIFYYNAYGQFDPLASLIHDARFRVRSGHLLRLAVLRGRPASLAFVSPHSD
ncbi:TonB-dependent receptor [Sphingobium baderi]|uniref:TonB-dependent receptor n=2 Tax=Sphingobium baderi TaxID=1332080 RepID=UPI0003F4B334|nr:TonB-dependent receptor plug domain-containing protein [Sphingobium baderi]